MNYSIRNNNKSDAFDIGKQINKIFSSKPKNRQEYLKILLYFTKTGNNSSASDRCGNSGKVKLWGGSGQGAPWGNANQGAPWGIAAQAPAWGSRSNKP